MAERRDKTDTSGRGLGFSFAADNVERGEPDADFIKRRLNFPFSDDPRARELDFEDTAGTESYAGRPISRAYKGNAPLEGQVFDNTVRVSALQKVSDLKAELPNQSVDTAALDAAKEVERATLVATDFQALFPTTLISSPAAGANFSPGDTISIISSATTLQNMYRAVLSIDGTAVESRILDRRDQDSTRSQEWRFFYDIPLGRALGPMDITVRTFNAANASRGIIADDAVNAPPLSEGIQGALGTLDGRPGSKTSSAEYQPLLAATQYLRAPGGAVTVTVNVV